MNRLELRNEVRDNIKRDSTAFSDAKINTRLDWAQERIADIHTFEEMRTRDTFSTSDSVSNYSFPSRMKDIYSMTIQSNGSSKKLVYVPARLFDQTVPNVDVAGTGLPGYYVDYGLNFDLYKVPNDVYTIKRRFSQYPRSLSTDTMASDLVRKDKLIIAAATAFGFWSIREVEDAEYWNKEVFAFLLSEAITTDHNAEDWVPVARGFSISGSVCGGNWLNPFGCG